MWKEEILRREPYVADWTRGEENHKMNTNIGGKRKDSWLVSRKESSGEEVGKKSTHKGVWKVLIVDDEEAVHSVTKLALNHLVFEEKRIEFISAFSAVEAKILLDEHPEIAVILLDVVMEEEDSGLKLAKYIRCELANRMVRIILRTGQPGQAPEEQVILEYDINDYKEKTELTARKLYSAMVTALRSYQDLARIHSSKRGLEKIIDATATIFAMQSMQKFAAGVLDQLAALLNITETALYIHFQGLMATREGNGDFLIVAGTGAFENVVGSSVAHVLPISIQQEIEEVFESNQNKFYHGKSYMLFRSKQGAEGVLYMENNGHLNEFDQRLIEIFCVNICIAFDNIELNKEIEETQRDCLYTLGEAAEARSRETGNHVKRVAECCWLLAMKYGLGPEKAGLLRLATPMHDMGKLAIPDSILNKPGKLTVEEFEVMKTHCDIGYDIMKKTPRTILQTAAMIAHQHHEKFDGTGYPQGLKGEEAHLFSRITALIDVFDALQATRVYKKPWPLEEILLLLKAERGKHFDPVLVDLFLENLSEFQEIYIKFPD
jgi:response regulator RpfG family c-di-GMP phosphodiesterase